MLDTELIPAAEADSKWLMVVLHGLGDSMEGFRWLPRALNNPRLNTLLANAPDDYHGGFSWYDIYDNRASAWSAAVGLLFDLLDRQRADGFATEQTFVFGFSQGCLMTLEVGVRYPHRFAGLVGISGYAHEPEQLVAGQSPVAPRSSRFSSRTARPIRFCRSQRPKRRWNNCRPAASACSGRCSRRNTPSKAKPSWR